MTMTRRVRAMGDGGAARAMCDDETMTMMTMVAMRDDDDVDGAGDGDDEMNVAMGGRATMGDDDDEAMMMMMMCQYGRPATARACAVGRGVRCRYDRQASPRMGGRLWAIRLAGGRCSRWVGDGRAR